MRPPLRTPLSDPETAPGTTPVIYTEAEVMRYIAMAKDRLQDVIVSTIFMGGMAPLDPDDPCYDIFKCDLYMDCDTNVESEYSASKIMPQDIYPYVLPLRRFFQILDCHAHSSHGTKWRSLFYRSPYLRGVHCKWLPYSCPGG